MRESTPNSPLRIGAISIRDAVANIVSTIKTFLLWVADMLEILDQYLVEKLGPNWWHDTPIAIFALKRCPND